MTKIALLSDIHGNTTALEAVLEDSRKAKVDEYWLLGDSLMPGTGRRALLELLEELPITVKVLGNWEDSLWRAMRGMLDETRPSHRYLMRQCQYILEEITPQDIGEQKDFDRLVTNPSCDIAVYGHIHQQFFRYGTGGELIINPGSIGQPFFLEKNLRKDLRAMYAILEFDQMGLKDIDFRRVDYDVQKELQLAKDLHLPYYQVYYESLVNGIHHTHDHELLHEIEQREGHDREIDAWLEDFFQ